MTFSWRHYRLLLLNVFYTFLKLIKKMFCVLFRKVQSSPGFWSGLGLPFFSHIIYCSVACNWWNYCHMCNIVICCVLWLIFPSNYHPNFFRNMNLIWVVLCRILWGSVTRIQLINKFSLLKIFIKHISFMHLCNTPDIA